jgi:hypothetical protein
MLTHLPVEDGAVAAREAASSTFGGEAEVAEPDQTYEI